MSERRITRRRGEAIRITGPATIRVNRRVTLTIEAPHESRIDRIDAPKTLAKPNCGENSRNSGACGRHEGPIDSPR